MANIVYSIKKSHLQFPLPIPSSPTEAEKLERTYSSVLDKEEEVEITW